MTNLNLNSPLRLDLSSPTSLVVDPGSSGQRGMNSNYGFRSFFLRKCGAEIRRISAKIPKYPVACRRSRFIGAAGIGIFVFRIGATKSRFIKSYLRFYWWIYPEPIWDGHTGTILSFIAVYTGFVSRGTRSCDEKKVSQI